MGTTYYAVNRDKTLAMELGKWPDLLPAGLCGQPALPAIPELAEVLRSHLDSAGFPAETRAAAGTLSVHLARELWSLGDFAQVITENAGEADYPCTVIVASVYTDPADRTTIGDPLAEWLN